MSTDLSNLSSSELTDVIAKAQKALAERQRSEKKAIIAQIHELAASIGVTVTIHGEAKTSRGNPRKGSKVAIKYRNPQDMAQVWTGRGVKPRWLKALLDLGHSIESFKL